MACKALKSWGPLWPHLASFTRLPTIIKPHLSSFPPSNTSSSFLPQGLCTIYSWMPYSPFISLPPCRFQLKYYLLREAFSDLSTLPKLLHTHPSFPQHLLYLSVHFHSHKQWKWTLADGEGEQQPSPLDTLACPIPYQLYGLRQTS